MAPTLLLILFTNKTCVIEMGGETITNDKPIDDNTPNSWDMHRYYYLDGANESMALSCSVLQISNFAGYNKKLACVKIYSDIKNTL